MNFTLNKNVQMSNCLMFQVLNFIVSYPICYKIFKNKFKAKKKINKNPISLDIIEIIGLYSIDRKITVKKLC